LLASDFLLQRLRRDWFLQRAQFERLDLLLS